MKAAIVYYSVHHENTKKLVDAIAAKHEVTLINAAEVTEAELGGYDMVGFASGIYYSKFDKAVIKLAQDALPEGAKVFLLYTFGAKSDRYTKAIREALKAKNADVLGEYGCFGYDSYGPFKLVGGVAKGHPEPSEIEGAVSFYESLI